MDKKILYIICEGSTDRITFYEPLKNYFSKNFPQIEVKVTKGDIAYKNDFNEANCISKIESYIKDYLRNYGLMSNEIIAIIQLIDTDGAFVDKSVLIEDKNTFEYKFADNLIYVNNVSSVEERFTKKKSIYKRLLTTNDILNIPYYKFFVSRNLEHALYNDINLTEDEKLKRAFDFSEKYSDDADGLYDFLKSLLFECPNAYDDSWKYIFDNNNSMKRCSNMIMLFDLVKEIFDSSSEESKINKIKNL